MLPNRATAVEMSPASHIVTSPISFHYHHHHPPPPTHGHHRRRRAPRLMPTSGPHRGELVDSAGAQRPHQQRHVTASNPVHNAPHQCHVAGPRRCQQCRKRRHVTAPQHCRACPPATPRHSPPMTPTMPPTTATSPPTAATQTMTTACATSLPKVRAGGDKRSRAGGIGGDALRS